MDIREALTFDDVLLVPAESAVLPSQTDTRTRLTPRVRKIFGWWFGWMRGRVG